MHALILALALASAPFSTSGGGGGGAGFVDAGAGLIAPVTPSNGLVIPNNFIMRAPLPDGGCQEYGWDIEQATGAIYLNTEQCGGGSPQAMWQIDGLATTIAPFSSGAMATFRSIETSVGFVGRSGAPYEAPYPSQFQAATSDNSTKNGYLSSNVSPDSSDSYGHNPGLKAHDDDNAYIRVQSVGYGNNSVKDYGFIGENAGILAGSLQMWLDNTSRDGFLTTYCADPAQVGCTEGIADLYCAAGANPRTCTAVRTQDKAGDVTYTGAVTPGTTLPTCASATRGAIAVKLGDGSTTNDKQCRCVNAAGTYKWTSIDLVTGTITATGNTTTCN